MDDAANEAIVANEADESDNEADGERRTLKR